MVIGQVAKNRLRKGDFQVRALPIPSKVPEKSQLPFPQKNQAFLVHGRRNKLGILHVIGPSFPVIHLALGSRLEFTVFQNGKAHPTIDHVTIVNPDSPLHGSRIKGCGMMICLSSLYCVYEILVHRVATLRMPLDSTAIPTRFSPDIALVNIVIVRQCNGRTLTHKIPERPAPKINFSQVVEHRQVNGTTVNSIPAHVLVDLVTRKRRRPDSRSEHFH